MSNCHRGDLVMVVRDTAGERVGGVTCVGHVIGTTMTVTHMIPTDEGNAWIYQGAPRIVCPHCNGRFLAFYDADLQPLRGLRILIDLDERNLPMATKRITADAPLFAEVTA